MNADKDLPERKHPRLKEYDYSSSGAYFITICTQDRKCILSEIVGRGLAPAEIDGTDDNNYIEYSDYGKIAEKQLLLLEERYPHLRIDKYVIMPNHIHAILILDDKAAGASPRPTVMDIVCSYKSLTTKECKAIKPIDKLFQTSFHEHIIRNIDDYNEISKYISQNPMLWFYGKLYSKE